MDNNDFDFPVETIDLSGGIGTLNEKTLHITLKSYFEPDKSKHEIKVLGYVADIVNDSGIIEIQTQGLNRLRKKLDVLLDYTNVTIVYPIAQTKWLYWIDKETGEISKKRKSPKKGNEFDAFKELYKIKMYLNNQNLHICLVLIDLEEYRYLDGWSNDKKKGSTRCERIPIKINQEIFLNELKDYKRFFPSDLNLKFTSRDFSKAAKINLRTAQIALNILSFKKAIVKVGKTGKLNLYQLNI